jgi:hypothetical protein
MYNLQETSLEWALLHVSNYYDSDFFPRLFEFDAIKRDWVNIKPHLLSIDLEDYAPQNPVISLAPKPQLVQVCKRYHSETWRRNEAMVLCNGFLCPTIILPALLF